MSEMELYHVHVKNNNDKRWIEGNLIKVSDSFDSVMNQRQQNFSQIMVFDNGVSYQQVNYSYYLAQYFNKIKDLSVVKKDDLEELKSLLEIGYEMTFNADFFKRETALENCRKDHYSELPSRLHCMYLCDSDGLEYWTDIISKNREEEVDIFRVLASGKIFKTNEQLLPNEFLNYQQTYNSSFSYWHPKFKDVPNFTNEYLAQGTMKLLEKIK